MQFLKNLFKGPTPIPEPTPKYTVVQKTIKLRVITQRVIIRMANGTDRFLLRVSKQPGMYRIEKVCLMTGCYNDQSPDARWVHTMLPDTTRDPEPIHLPAKDGTFVYTDNEGIHIQTHACEIKEVIHEPAIETKDTYDFVAQILVPCEA